VLQRELLTQQDAQLDELSRVVTSTRHIALAVNEELSLHSRLLDEVEDEVEHTTGRLVMATKKLKLLLARNNNCKRLLCLLLTIALLVAVLLLALRLAPAAALG
jgi:SYP5 family syntaxin